MGLNGIQNTSYLFQNMFGSNTSNNTTSGASLLSDYAAIKNGSYLKLAKAYYKQKKSQEDTTASKNETSALATMKNEAGELSDVLKQISDTGEKSIFAQVEKKNEATGAVELDYNRDRIAAKVSSFVKSYNQVLEAADKIDNTFVLQRTVQLTGDIKTYADSLDKIGIQIGKDNKLTIDEAKFKSSTMTDVKTLFQGSYSMASRMEKRANDILRLSDAAIHAESLYDKKAGYLNPVSSGNLYDAIL